MGATRSPDTGGHAAQPGTEPLEPTALGEVVWRVPPLAVPRTQPQTELDELSSYAAVHLFVDRARSVRSDFALTPHNVRAVAQVCTLLEGLPLALELAAARVRVLGTEQIEEQLGDSMRLLVADRRSTSGRHRSLEAVLDLSYALLSGPGRTAFRRLAVFAGDWTLEAAEAVCGEGEVPGGRVLDVLTQLVDKSLVVMEEEEGHARYRLLEPIRQYAHTKLLASDEASTTRQRHASYFCQLSEDLDSTSIGQYAQAVNDRMQRELANFRAAMAFAALVSAALPAVAQETPGGSPAAAAARASIGGRANDGAHVVNQHSIDARTLDITVDSPALGTTANVRLLLPPDWFRQPDGRWPVLYLLHPAFVDYTAWTQNTDVEALTAHTDVLVVMPEAGFIPTYSNWWNHGAFGPPAWETFHLTELRQILERGFHAGRRLAIAGASLGGLGAMSYAARHPTLFRASASFSGVLDSRSTALGVPAALLGLFQQFTPAHDALAIWGDPVEQADSWGRTQSPGSRAAAASGHPPVCILGQRPAWSLGPSGHTEPH